MPSVTPPPCSHDLGPGTTVCLRCRQEERQSARLRQRRALTRAGLVVAGVAVIAVTANAALHALRASGSARATRPLQLLASTTTSSVRQQGAPAGAPAPVDSAPAKPVATTPATVASGLTLKVPLGRTGLRDSMYVERGADSAVVHFDTELGRTRRRDKFETVVRTTLPVLYGARADSMLATLPEGAITGDRDLVSEVAVRGVRLPVPAGGTLELWPVTRPGRDGPLVVGYRVRVTP